MADPVPRQDEVPPEEPSALPAEAANDFMPGRHRYDARFRPYRMAVYAVFLIGVVWFSLSVLLSLVDYLF